VTRRVSSFKQQCRVLPVVRSRRLGFQHAPAPDNHRFRQVGHVNCSGQSCRHGNFHLGCLPECAASELSARFRRENFFSRESVLQPTLPTTASESRWRPGSRSASCEIELRLSSCTFPTFRVILTAGCATDPKRSLPEYEGPLNPPKCLWKLMFFGHSQHRLKVA
jgi:hypothetical protein